MPTFGRQMCLKSHAKPGFRLAHPVRIGRHNRLTEPGDTGRSKMKKIMIIAAASLMFVATAQAEDQFEIQVEMTPIVKEQKKVVAAKSDDRFANYALENVAAGGQ